MQALRRAEEVLISALVAESAVSAACAKAPLEAHNRHYGGGGRHFLSRMQKRLCCLVGSPGLLTLK